MKATIIGAGSWGTALAVVLQSNGHDVMIWAREPEIAKNINENHHNPTYLPDLDIPESIRCSTCLTDGLHERDLVVFATPSHTMREVAERVKPYLSGNEIVVSVSKGIENNSYLTMTQVLTQVVVSAAYSRGAAKFIQEAFMTPMFRVYVNYDVIGVEVAGSVKNIMAIAAGIVDGADLGDNIKSALITRGLFEMTRLGARIGASRETFSGLAGIGDLIVTCTSQHSRNRFVGYHIGLGEKLEDIISKMDMIAEGVKSTQSVYGWSKKLGIEMPITDIVYRVLFEGMNPQDAMFELMTREAKDETRL